MNRLIEILSGIKSRIKHLKPFFPCDWGFIFHVDLREPFLFDS